MSKDNKDAIDSIMQGVQYLIDESIKVAPFDRIKIGRILAKNDDGTYIVLVDGKEYSMLALGSGGLYVGNVVKVLIPQNEYSAMFILNSPDIQYSTTNLTAGVSPLPDGEIYLVYE